MAQDLTKLADRLAEGVRAYVSRSLAPLLQRFEVIEGALDALPAKLKGEKGARGEATSVAGLTSASVMAALIDHLQEFQDGPFPSRETALTITKLQEALFWERHRADLRAARGVLGKEIK